MQKNNLLFRNDKRGIFGDEIEPNFVGGFIFYSEEQNKESDKTEFEGSGYEFFYNSEENAKLAFEAAQKSDYPAWILKDGTKDVYTKSAATVYRASLVDDREIHLTLYMIHDGKKIIQFLSTNPNTEGLEKIIKKLGYAK